MKNKSVHSCRFVQHAKFHCIMTTLNRLFKIEFGKGKLENADALIGANYSASSTVFLNTVDSNFKN